MVGTLVHNSITLHSIRHLQSNQTKKENPRSIALTGSFRRIYICFVIAEVTLCYRQHLTPHRHRFKRSYPWPGITSVLALIVLVFQALLLAHGGITTLGANVVSMGIVGPLVAYAIWIAAKKVKVNNNIGIFLAAAIGDLATYLVTSAQLALAFPTPAFADAFIKFGAIFAITQIPLAIAEGILAVVLFDFLAKYKKDFLVALKVIKLPTSQPKEATKQ